MSRFRIRKRKPKPHARREIPVRAMVPNLITMAAAASGITSIRFSCQGQWRYAVVAILIACFLDGIDGRMARLLKVSSRLGAELDSLADFVNFGVAPALFAYFWIMEAVPKGSLLYPVRGMFWAFALFYAMCGAFRLARFNIMVDSDDSAQPYWKHFFVGLPSPGAAGLVLTPAIWELHTDWDVFQSPWVGSFMLLFCGTLMASRVPTLSIKKMRVPQRLQLPLTLFVAFVIGMLVAHSWLTLGVIGIFYLLSVPVCVTAFIRARAAHRRRASCAPAPAAENKA
ncbi:MAG: phosphatidylcholine/phosphatidylserine synthase [Kiritimatiellaeota bacterium]|nr:phosphatidylcholine/phosphatidylserine synthase [Kiritimatiellota bacterium]